LGQQKKKNVIPDEKEIHTYIQRVGAAEFAVGVSEENTGIPASGSV
jgi:hypothetical protein